MKKTLALAMLAVAGASQALVFDLTGGTGGGAVADGTASNNSAGATTVITFNVGTLGTITAFRLAGLNLTHTFAGDLSVVLKHNGVAIDLMDRNYRTTATGFGLGGDLGGGQYMFDESASLMPTTATIAAGTYGRNSNAGFGSTSSPNSYANLVGQSLDGVWTIEINDWAAADTGSTGSTIRIVGDYDAVPEPATMAALGLGAAALIRRRRK